MHLQSKHPVEMLPKGRLYRWLCQKLLKLSMWFISNKRSVAWPKFVLLRRKRSSLWSILRQVPLGMNLPIMQPPRKSTTPVQRNRSAWLIKGESRESKKANNLQLSNHKPRRKWP